MFKLRCLSNLSHKYLFPASINLRITSAINTNQQLFVKEQTSPEKSEESTHRHRRPNFNYVRTKFSPHNEDPWDNSIEFKSKESEPDFSVRAKNDPDSFGEPEKLSENDYIDDGDIQEEKFFTERPAPGKKLRTKQYADIIKAFIRQRKIKEAIDVLEVRMIKEDRVKPESYIYNLLLGACGRVGYTKKAFKLYNDMKKRGFKAMGGTYTALFNACANSPWPLTDGLSGAKHLYNIMIEKGDQPNDSNYNAMIKAFGRCGDLPMAFSLVDEMVQKGFRIQDDTISFLLQACISDKESGFRHSLLVWRKLIEKNIRPSVYTFNLMLRCVRDCGLGDLETTKDVIKKLIGDDVEALPEQGSLLLAGEGNTAVEELNDTSEIVPISGQNLRPNLLAYKPHLGNILSLSEVKQAEERLILVGGCKGFLEIMSQHKCTPDIKTFSQLLDCIPNTLSAEKELIASMRKLDIKPDIDFYNMLIKKKSMRGDYEGAQATVVSMRQRKFRPNLITYGVLAIGCRTKEDANKLLSEMKATGYTLNSAILGAMLQQGCYHMQFDYIFEIMEMCLRESVPVNRKFLDHLEGFKEKMKAKLDAKELNERSIKMFGIFKARYKSWLTEIQIDESEQAHPWQQYRQNNPADVKFKPKDSARFKQRHISKFKVKTSTKVRY